MLRLTPWLAHLRPASYLPKDGIGRVLLTTAISTTFFLFCSIVLLYFPFTLNISYLKLLNFKR